MKTNTTHTGDCLEVMKTFPDNSIDTMITDPPAGIAFMGRKWDSDKGGRDQWIAWLTEIMKECYRVLKPGATALVWALPRTSHWTATAVEDAGFEIKDIVMHIFGSGFPKATDISKQLDRGHKRKIIKKTIDRGRPRAMAPGGAKRNADPSTYITAPATDEAKLWNGWKSHGLKPAAEHWIMAKKKNDGTYANNALTWGVSGLNIDGGRIGYESKEDFDKVINPTKTTKKGYKHTAGAMTGGINRLDAGNPQGRFPANLILECICDTKAHTNPECPCYMLDAQSGVLGDSFRKKKNFGNNWGVGNKDKTLKEPQPDGFKGKGGASRFFYCAKSSKSERNAGCEELEEKMGPETQNSEFRKKSGTRGAYSRSNHHPTVKPIRLMQYLCKLTETPTKGVVLDPFMGSGSTLIAAKMEGRDYIGIEQNPEYVKIAEARIKNVKDKLL